MSAPVFKSERQGAVAVITICRPEAINSFNRRLRLDLLAAFEQAAADRSVRVVVLTGQGRAFSAGADLKDVSQDRNIEKRLQTEYRPILECIATMQQPVIGAVNGAAAGIGMAFALSCDLLVMAEDAFLLAPFTTISLVPDGGLCWLLVHLLGYRRAFQLSVESERISAARCVELGLANKMVPGASLMDETLEWAETLSRRAPLSVAATKKAMRFAAASDWASTFDLEAHEQLAMRASADHAEGVKAFFEKRKARFRGE